MLTYDLVTELDARGIVNGQCSMIINADLESVAYVRKIEINKSGWSEINYTNVNTHGLLYDNAYFCQQQNYNSHERQKMQSLFIFLCHQTLNRMSF